MALRDQEISLQSGSPYFLYEFNTDDATYRYIDYAGGFEWNGFTWEGSSIKHTEVKRGGGVNKQGITVTVPFASGEFAQSFRQYIRDRRISFNLFRGQFGQPDTELEYKGRYMSHKRTADNVVLTMEHIATSSRRSGCFLKFEKLCPYTVYDPHTCTLNPDDWTFTGTVSGDSFRNIIYLSGIDNFEYKEPVGGFLTFSDGKTAGIQSYYPGTGDAVDTYWISKSVAEDYIGQEVSVTLGCNGTTAACRRFGNYANYMGLPWTPLANPFDSAVEY